MKRIKAVLSPAGARHDRLLDLLREDGFSAYVEDEESVTHADYFIAPRVKSREKLPARGITPFEYADREDFKKENGRLTAEAALTVARNASELALCGSDVLVCGYGCIAKPLVRDLLALGARVTVAARSELARKDAESAGAFSDGIPITRGGYDFVFNTVPAPVLDDGALSLLPDAVVIDLASLPGGVTGECKKLCPAQGLPGKYMPVSAARVIFNCFKAFLKEEGAI
ncbi:MAG: hypothetical protein IJS65_03665 [Clostridia bacterium]|nr:hypothetical protein [Clostridia bacterium]